jgi:cytochrome oxidase Cu insertion factor (SCO1/SenC/PrrC family)
VPGMSTGLSISNGTVVAAFKDALVHQGLLALLIFTLLAAAWLAIRPRLAQAGRTASGRGAVGRNAIPEPAWRRLLRIGFGVIWVFDGILQAQPKMALGLPSQVIEPAAASSPAWVQHVVNWAGTGWSSHPVQAGAAAVWIQAGIGLWLLAGARGPLSRLAGLASVSWGLVVWVFGEAFGGMFSPGQAWSSGAPGGALFYVAAGALIALPDRAWRTRRSGRLMTTGLGLFLAAMAVLQAWPGRGFWQGTVNRQPGSLTAMIQSMASTPQPRFLAVLVSHFGSVTAAHGFAVNLLIVVALALTGAAFLSGRAGLIRPVMLPFIVLCVADWVLIQDLGFFGGLGTDPNSMLPMALLAAAGYLAVALEPAPAVDPGVAPAASHPARPGLAGLRELLEGSGFQSLAAVGAISVIVLGAAPLAAAQANPVADTILAQALDGTGTSVSYPAPAFSLVDQAGRAVTLATLRGKVVLLTFLDPVCTNDCPVIAQEFRGVGQQLGAADSRVELVAIVANPIDYQVGYTRAFDRQERLASVPNWLFLTGTVPQLQQAWKKYGVAAEVAPAGSMILHSDVAYVIDSSGRVRDELNMDPGPGTTATVSSFAAELTADARKLLGQS